MNIKLQCSTWAHHWTATFVIITHINIHIIDIFKETDISMSLYQITEKVKCSSVIDLGLHNLFYFTTSFNPFVPNGPFPYPLKTSEKLKVFWCFQGIEKGCIENEWVKATKMLILGRKALRNCTNGCWIKADFYREFWWQNGHPICKVSLVNFDFRFYSLRSKPASGVQQKT